MLGVSQAGGNDRQEPAATQISEMAAEPPLMVCIERTERVGSPRWASRRTLQAATGWLELGLADEALYELETLPTDARTRRDVLEVKLAAQMVSQKWNRASDTARILCLKAADEPVFFLRAAFCLHETGDTLAACNWLLRGPKTLFEMAVFHYNLACYLWTLGEANRARSHLKQAIAMDESFLEAARDDRDLAGIGPLG